VRLTQTRTAHEDSGVKGLIVGRRFEILERAGAGAMGTVYRGRDRRSGAPVAIKVLHDLSEAATSRFTDEVRVLQTLAHPAIIELLGYGRLDPPPSGEGPGAPWMAMEWVEGGDLASALARGWEPSVEEATALARRVGAALGAAHAAGIVHRDVKPANIMLPGGDPAQAKLVDFGIAAARADDWAAGRARGAGTVVGTPDYMAPEQAHGDTPLDARADVYALGTVLFECLTSSTPFQGERGLGILAQKLFDEAPRANEVLADFDQLPDALDALIASALSRERAARPRDGHAFVAALDAALGEAHDPVPERGTLRTLTSKERRALAVLAIHAPEDTPKRRLSGAFEDPAFHLERLRPGLWVASLQAKPGAPAVAARALEAARAVTAAILDAKVGVALGKGEIGASGWAGEPFARAVELVETLADREGGERVLLDPTAAMVEGSEGAPPTDCVGREKELTLLDRGVTQAAARGQVYVAPIFGGPGMGKTLLLQTWLARRAARGAPSPALVLRGREQDSRSPHAAIARAIAAWSQAPAGALITRRRRALRARLETLGGREASERLAPWLGELVGLAFPARSDPTLEAARRTPSLMLARTAHALASWIELLAEAGAPDTAPGAPPGEARSALVVVEDGHWVDGATLQLLEETLRLIRAPGSVVLTARPSLMRRSEALWASDLAGPPIQLGPLSEEDAAALVRATWEHTRRAERDRRHEGARPGKDRLGPGSAPPERPPEPRPRDRDDGQFPGSGAERDRLRPGEPPAPIADPTAGFAARLDRAPTKKPAPSSKHTGPLRAELDRIVGRAEGNPLLLVELTRWVASGNPPEGAPETALGLAAARLTGLSADERRAMRAAAVFGRRFSEGGVAALLGGQGELTSVRRWLYAARAKHLVTRIAPPPEAGSDRGPWYEMASALLVEAAYDTLPDEDRRVGHGMALAWLRAQGVSDEALLGRHALAAGAFSEAASSFLSAATRAARVGDEDAARALLASYGQALERAGTPPESARWAEIWAMEGELDLAAGAAEAAATSARSAVDAARRGADRELLARSLLTLGRAHLSAGAWHTATETLTEARRVAETLDDAVTAARVSLSLGEALAADHPHESLAAYHQAMGEFERLGDAVGVAGCLRGVAEVALRWGDPDAATLHAREAISLLRPLGATRETIQALSTLGEALASAGRREEALEVFEELDTEGAGLAPRALLPSHLAQGRAMLALGALTEAQTRFATAARLAEAGELPGAHLEAWAGIACCARAEQGTRGQWSQALSRAVELAEDHGLPPGPAVGLLTAAARDVETRLGRRVRALVARTRSAATAPPMR